MLRESWAGTCTAEVSRGVHLTAALQDLAAAVLLRDRGGQFEQVGGAVHSNALLLAFLLAIRALGLGVLSDGRNLNGD